MCVLKSNGQIQMQELKRTAKNPQPRMSKVFPAALLLGGQTYPCAPVQRGCL